MKNTIAIILLIVFSLSLYTLTVRGDFGNPDMGNQTEMEQLVKATGPFESSHERASYAQYIAMTKRGRFDLSKELADFASPDAGYLNDKFYSYFPPGISLIITPLAKLGGKYNLEQVLAYSSISIIAILSLVLIYLICSNVFRLPKEISILSALIFGFSTPAWFYSVSIYQHIVNAFLMLSIFYLSWLGKNRNDIKWLTAVFVGLLFGISMLFDYPNLILLLPAIIYFLATNFSIKKERVGYKLSANILPILLFVVLTAAAIIPQLYMNYVQFGSPLQFTNTLPRHIIEPGQNEETIVEEVAEETGQKSNQVFREFNLIKGLYILTVAPDKGLFFFSPILFLGLFGLFSISRRFSWEGFFLTSSIILNIGLYASFGDPWGGWAYGARYLVPSMALLPILAGIWMNKYLSSNTAKTAVFLLIALSCAIALLGALTTGLTPPKVEADFLRIKYGLPYNYEFLAQNQSSSFLYNNFLSGRVTLNGYMWLIFTFIMTVFAILLSKAKPDNKKLDKIYHGN